MKSNIFKFMSVVAFACFIFTLFEIGIFMILGTSLGYVGMAAIVLSSIACLGTAYILKKGSNIGIMLAAAVVSSGIISVATAFLLGLTGVAAVMLFSACVIVSVNAYKACNKTLSETMSKKKVLVINLVTVGLLGYVSLYTNLVFLSKEFVISFGISAVFSMYILNRSVLDNLYAKKSSNTFTVSSVIQKYNFHIVSGFAALLVLILLGKDFLAYILKVLGLNAMIGILNLLNSGGIDHGPPPGPDIHIDTINPDPGPVLPILVFLLNNIATVMAILIMIVVLIFFIRFLIMRAPEKFRLLWWKLKVLLSRILGLDDAKIREEGIDFMDELSDLSKDELAYDKRYKIYKNYRKVSHIKDPVERMRAYYGFFMTSLKKNNVPLYAHDTSYDIYDKTYLVSDNDDQARGITEIYNDVRYGDIIPSDKMLVRMDKYIKEITKSFTENKNDKII